jgi:hypothetical protein
MKKIILSILVFAIFAVFTVPAAAQEVYFVPQQSNAIYCETINVEIWANASDFYGGQINLTYDPTCANVTNWMRNTTNFPLGGWSHYDGREWITFSAMPPTPLLTGEYMIGTLTIHCVNDTTVGCVTPLAFIEPSTLLDDIGAPVTANWIDGTFTCPTPTPTPTPTATPLPGGVGGGGGAGTLPTPTPTLTPTLSPTSTSTPSLSPTTTPTPSPTPSLTPTSTPSPTPKPVPGFEAFFAILWLLAVAYLLGRK